MSAQEMTEQEANQLAERIRVNLPHIKIKHVFWTPWGYALDVQWPKKLHKINKAVVRHYEQALCDCGRCPMPSIEERANA